MRAHCRAHAEGAHAASCRVARQEARRRARSQLVALRRDARARASALELWLARGEGALFGGLWNLPMAEGRGRDAAAARCSSSSGLRGTLAARPRGELEHVLTHRRLQVQLWRVQRRAGRRGAASRGHAARAEPRSTRSASRASRARRSKRAGLGRAASLGRSAWRTPPSASLSARARTYYVSRSTRMQSKWSDSEAQSLHRALPRALQRGPGAARVQLAADRPASRRWCCTAAATRRSRRVVKDDLGRDDRGAVREGQRLGPRRHRAAGLARGAARAAQGAARTCPS